MFLLFMVKNEWGILQKLSSNIRYFFLIHCVYAQSGADYGNGLRPQFLRFEAHNLLWQWAIFARFGTIKFYNDFPIFS